MLIRKIVSLQISSLDSYFAIYEAMVALEIKRKQISRKELPLTSAAGYGAFAGVAMWLW